MRANAWESKQSWLDSSAERAGAPPGRLRLLPPEAALAPLSPIPPAHPPTHSVPPSPPEVLVCPGAALSVKVPGQDLHQGCAVGHEERKVVAAAVGVDLQTGAGWVGGWAGGWAGGSEGVNPWQSLATEGTDLPGVSTSSVFARATLADEAHKPSMPACMLCTPGTLCVAVHARRPPTSACTFCTCASRSAKFSGVPSGSSTQSTLLQRSTVECRAVQWECSGAGQGQVTEVGRGLRTVQTGRAHLLFTA
jgi:hypothetical protein